jgi:hypothetical protein
VFFDDFSKVIVKLFELGVPFDESKSPAEGRWIFKSTHERELEADVQ